LSGGDNILCTVDTKNRNGQSIVFDNLGWSISILATENSNFYFPIQSSTIINTNNGRIRTSFSVPKCNGTKYWDISLIVNQEPIGGNKFILWSKENVEIVNDDNTDIDDQCVIFRVDQLTKYINSINSKLAQENGSIADEIVDEIVDETVSDISTTLALDCGDSECFNGSDSTTSSDFFESYYLIIILCAASILLIGFYIWKKKKNPVWMTRTSVDLEAIPVSNTGTGTIKTKEPKTNGKRKKPAPPPSKKTKLDMVPTKSVEDVPNNKKFGKCAECGSIKAGKVDNSDGAFYCYTCWENYQ